MRKRGEITVFLSLTLVCILSLLMGLLESARTAGARLYLTMAANSAMASLMSQYNRNLWDMYRLLYLEYESEAAIKESFEDYLNFYLEQDNFYPIKNRETEIMRLVTMPENGGKTLEDEILSCVKYRLPEIAADIGGISRQVAEASKAGDFKTLFRVCRETGRRTRRLEKAGSNIEDALEEMEKLLDKTLKAADGEKERRFEDNAEKLLKKMKRFPDLVDKYEDGIAELSSQRKEAEGQAQTVKGQDWQMSQAGVSQTRVSQAQMAVSQVQANADSEMTEAMGTELAACKSAEEAAKKLLSEYRKAEEILGQGQEAVQEALEILEESREMEEDGEEAETDWDGIRERLESVEIPETGGARAVDKEKSAALDRLETLLSGNLLKLVMPEGTEVSQKRVSLKGSFGTGRSVGKEYEERTLIEKFLIHEYMGLYFDSFSGACSDREPLEDQALLYEQEYLLCGKASDEKNLEGTAEKLLAVRGAMNLVYLLNTPEKKIQADELALSVSGGNAPVQLILSFFILTLWALGEAVWDVRCLLDGGKVPFWKTTGTWRLGISGLLELEFLNGRQEGDSTGSSYAEYLKLLLFLEDQQTENYRMMDVIQWNVRKKQADFAAADCAGQVEIRANTVQRHLFLLKSEYTKTVDTAWAY